MPRLVHLILNNIYIQFFVLFICGFAYGCIFAIQFADDASVNAFLSFETR